MYFSEKIARKIALLKRALSYLRSKSDVQPTEIEENYELKSALERNLHVAIEAALDIGEMIIAEEGLSRSEEYKGKLTLWQAAEKCRLSLWEIIDEARKREIQVPYSLEELKEEIRELE